MKILPSQGFPNLRCRTEADARKVMECVKFRKPIDPKLIVLPYVFAHPVATINQNYMDAQFELTIVEFEQGDNEIVDVKPLTQ